MAHLSPLRARLASFEHAYVVAIRLRQATGTGQFIIRTGNLLQPVRIAPKPPADASTLIALVA